MAHWLSCGLFLVSSLESGARLMPNYAAGLITAFPKRFLRPLPREKSPKVSVLEAESSRRHNDSTSFLEKVIFPKIFACHTPRTKVPHCWGPEAPWQ